MIFSSQKKPERIPGTLFVLGCVFIAVRALYLLELPLFWDEMGVYAPYALYFHDHGWSTLFSVPDEITRGHPPVLAMLFSPAAYAGEQAFLISRLIAFSITLLTLLSVYHCFKSIITKPGAALAALFLAVQPLFVAQSTLVLPEMLLALCAIWSIYAFIKAKWLLYLLACSIAIWTKETAILIPFALSLFLIVEQMIRRKEHLFAFKRLVITASPLLSLILFLVLQKLFRGWYFYPYHVDLVSLSADYFNETLSDQGQFLFFEQGRWFVLIAVVSSFLVEPKKGTAQPSNHLKWVISSVVVVSLLFFAFNFKMHRYLLFLFPLIALLVGNALSEIWARNRAIAVVLGLLVLVPPNFKMTNGSFDYDNDLDYSVFTGESQHAVQRFLDMVGKDERVYANFPMVYALEDARYGYSALTQGQVQRKPNEATDWLFISDPGSYDWYFPDQTQFELVAKLRSMQATFAIYRKK